MLRRTIHPEVRVLDEKQGLVEYVASSETIDSYQEIIKADGWRFDDFQKNAPFVDSHNYDSIDCLLGRVADFQVKGRKLIEQVKWAIDVPTNTLALKGFQMTSAGYLKAVSVGFVPSNYVTPYDRDQDTWRAACEEMNIDPTGNCRCIYLEQQQKELSACVIGANPDALARSYAAGIFSDRDVATLAKRWPEFARNFERATKRDRRRSFSFSSNQKPDASVSKMMGALGIESEPPAHTMKTKTADKQNFLSIDSVPVIGDYKRACEALEFARRSDNAREAEHAVRAAFAAQARERQCAYGNPVERYLNANPERRFFWNGVARTLAAKKHKMQIKINPMEADAVQKSFSGIDVSGALGTGLHWAYPVADEVYDLLLHYGAYKYLGLRKMIGAYTKYPKATGFPDAIFITQSQQGKTTIPEDTSLTGGVNAPTANTIAAIITASLQWVQDEKVDISEVIMSKFLQGLGARIDWGCFQGTGADDTTNGAQLGLFVDPTVNDIFASAGVAKVAGLTRADFVNTIGGVNAAALQRMEDMPPRWYISPQFVASLLALKDGTGPNYLLKTPAETGKEWHLVGFPVTWAAQAPSAELAGAAVAAFGNPDAYLVALHEQFEIGISNDGANFGSTNTQIRSLGRGFSQMREVTGFSRLKLAK